MTLSFKTRFQSCIVHAITGIMLTGCSTDDNKKSVSEDLAALKAIVQVPTETESVRWEIFGTPEYTGGVPGPTDYMTLVAELSADEKLWTALPKKAPADVYIVPQAARPWLSNDFRELLDTSKHANLTVSDNTNCKPYHARLTKSAKPVSGFICKVANRFLLYMVILSKGS